MTVKGGVYDLQPVVCGEIKFIENLFVTKA